MLVSLAVTALLSFLAGSMVTAWALSGDPRTARNDVPALAFETVAADEPDRLRLVLAPAERVGAAEAAALAPEVFPATPTAVDAAPMAAAYTVHLGTFLKPEQAEATQRNAEMLGLAATTRLLVDVRGRAWYSVQAGLYGDRLSAALAARSFEGAHAIALPAPSQWSRG